MNGLCYYKPLEVIGVLWFLLLLVLQELLKIHASGKQLLSTLIINLDGKLTSEERERERVSHAALHFEVDNEVKLGLCPCGLN